MSKLIVIQYEQFFDVNNAGDVGEAMREGLEALRMYAGARVVGSYEAEEDVEFQQKAVDSIIIGCPVKINVDY